MLHNRYKIYILSYDNETFDKASEHFYDKLWADIIKIDTTVYLENIMYDSWLIDHKDEWINYDYVGTLSWKSYTKFNISTIDSQKNMNITHMRKPDVVSFMPISLSLLGQAVMAHGDRFKVLWTEILKRTHTFSIDQILDRSVKLFCCNYWMAKPNVMLDYIGFFQKIKYILENTKEIQDDLWSDAKYNGYVSRENLNKIFGKSYYTFHPFLLERFPCLFFHHKYKILMQYE